MSAVIQSQSFEERVYEKIRTDIGSLMTDEELKKLVEKSIERMFFTERTVAGHNSWDRGNKLPPLIFEAVQKALEAKINEQVKQYVLDHSEFYTKAIEDALGKGFLTIARQYFDSMVNGAMQPALYGIQQSLNAALTPR